MCKISLQESKMRSSAYVEQAATWAKDLTHRESRGPGDMENAWRRLETRYGISVGTFWSLRYRKPQNIFIEIFAQLQAAHRAECERQMRKLAHEIEITKAITGASHAAVCAAEALLGEKAREVK